MLAAADSAETLNDGLEIKHLLNVAGDELADLDTIGQSWFEDDPQVAEAVKRARGGNRAKLASYLLQSVLAKRRDRWAELVLCTALWMREAPPEADLCWRELALVAKALILIGSHTAQRRADQGRRPERRRTDVMETHELTSAMAATKPKRTGFAPKLKTCEA